MKGVNVCDMCGLSEGQMPKSIQEEVILKDLLHISGHLLPKYKWKIFPQY